MSLRKAIFWVHLVAGVAAAIVILMLAVTGVILTYEAQLNRWALYDYRADPPGPGVTPLELDELIAHRRAARRCRHFRDFAQRPVRAGPLRDRRRSHRPGRPLHW